MSFDKYDIITTPTPPFRKEEQKITNHFLTYNLAHKMVTPTFNWHISWNLYNKSKNNKSSKVPFENFLFVKSRIIVWTLFELEIHFRMMSCKINEVTDIWNFDWVTSLSYEKYDEFEITCPKVSTVNIAFIFNRVFKGREFDAYSSAQFFVRLTELRWYL